MRLSRGSRWFCLMVTALTVGARLGAAAVEDAAQFTQPPPAAYLDSVAQLLTPASEVLSKESEYSHLQGDGIVLLDEVVHYVAADGRRLSVYHYIDKALNESGAQSLAQSSFTFKKNLQRAYLVTAQTIQPDGTRDPVKSDAVFLKSPQDELGDSIYDDNLSMLTVFSKVKPGSVTESIVVLEELEPRIPGQYTQVYTWVDSWPTYAQRLVVDLPKSFADRLKITNLGTGIPTPSILHPTPLRQRLTWEKLNTPAEENDHSGAPTLQTGPLVWLSTLPDWDTFASWYNDLIKGTDQLNPELKGRIDAWTKDTKDPAEILRILYEHVARDIRYTGFELGQSDFKPHDCASVWERQYGDCKDKANLLRAMLAYKGIPSWLTLLSTVHAGLISKGSVDYRPFNHCILEVQIGEQNIICDPTIAYGEPGLLGNSESNRDLLVIKGARAEWIHTPAMKDATIAYSFDLQLRPSGELAGWVEKQATGYYYATEMHYFQDLTKVKIQDALQNDVRSFFPNANVVDATPVPPAPPPGSPRVSSPPVFTMRAYMVLPGVLTQGATSTQLPFPALDSFLPYLENFQSRRHDTYLWSDIDRVAVKIQLPAGWTAQALPAPQVYDSASAGLQAVWTANADLLTANFSVTTKQALFHPDEMQSLGNAITNLKAWAAKSLILSRTGAMAAAVSTDAELAANLPMMPTGEGQINLIDSEFPKDGNRAARRAALERIPVLFPADKKSMADAALDLALMDLDDKKWPDVIARVQTTLEANRSAMDGETIGWADYLTASALLGQGKKDEARAAFRAIADDPKMDAFRRGWAIYKGAQLMADQSPADALNYAETGLDLDSTALPLLYGFYASTAIANGGAERLKERLVKLIAAKPDNLETILLQISDATRDLIQSAHAQDGMNLLSLLESLANPATTGDAFARALKQVRVGSQSLGIYAKVQENLKQALALYPELAALEQKQPPFASQADARKSATQHENNKEVDDALVAALHAAIDFPVDPTFPQRFWECVQYAEWAMRNAPAPAKDSFFYKLAEAGKDLPHETDAYADTQILLAHVFELQNRRAEASDIYEFLEKQTDLAEGFQSVIFTRAGTNWAAQGDYAKALGAYHAVEAYAGDNTNAREGVLRAAFLQLDDGNKAEALRLLQILTQSAQKGKIKPGEQITDFIAVAQGSSMPAYWDAWQAWWPQWQQIEAAAGLDAVKDLKVVPVISSLDDLGGQIKAAKNNKDAKLFFSLLRQIAYAARDYPQAAMRLTGFLLDAEAVLPDKADDLRRLDIAILKPLAPASIDDQRLRILRLLIEYDNTNQNDQALALVKAEWTPALDDGGRIARDVHIDWAVAAVARHEDLEAVRELLVKDLASPSEPDRSYAVGLLADAYMALGQPQNADSLIAAELTNPVIVADPDVLRKLKSRLENLRNVTLATKQLADGVALWLAAHQPDWWDFAEPKSSSDPRLARLDVILNNSTGEFQPAELVKAGLLAPSTPALSVETQQDGVLRAFDKLYDILPTQDQADDFAQSILDNAALPQSLKLDFLYDVLAMDGSSQHLESFEHFRQSPLFDSFSSSAKDYINRIGEFAKIDRTSPSALTGSLQNLAKHPLDQLDLEIAQDGVSYLLQLGDIEDAAGIYQAAANYTLAPGERLTKPEFQLTLLKDINATKQLKPVLDAFRQIVLGAHPPETIAQPAGFEQRGERLYFADLPEAEANDYRLYLIKIHQEPPALFFWLNFMRDQKHGAASTELTLQLLQAGLAAAATDDIKAQMIVSGAGVLDLDDAAIRQKFFALVQPYRDPVKFPQTMENIRMLDVNLNLRTGQPVNLETDLAGFTSRLNATKAVAYKLRAYLQAKDVARLKNTLNGLTADQLMSTFLIRTTLPALEAAGLNDEAELARDTLNKKLNQDILATWFQPLGSNLDAVMYDLEGLQSTQGVPAAFTRFVESRVARPQSLLAYELLKAYLEQDWKTAVEAGDAYTKAYPNFYAQYWYYGRSLAELGRRDEAIKVLTVYCQYSADEISYPAAKALLEKLKAAQK